MLIRSLLSLLLLTSLSWPLPASSAELSVFAASSLSESLREVLHRYQTEQPDQQVHLHFAGSQTLATQIEQGAPADLFISANQLVMQRLEQQGLVAPPVPLLGNRLIIAVRSDLPAPLQQLSDLARPGLLLAIGNPQVPVGFYTRQFFSRLANDPHFGTELIQQIEANVISQESRVKAIIAKLLLGEVDAGIVYQSDLNSASGTQLKAMALPEQHNPQASYPLAKVRGAAAEADQLLAFLRSEQALQVFLRHGFSPGVTP